MLFIYYTLLSCIFTFTDLVLRGDIPSLYITTWGLLTSQLQARPLIIYGAYCMRTMMLWQRSPRCWRCHFVTNSCPEKGFTGILNVSLNSLPSPPGIPTCSFTDFGTVLRIGQVLVLFQSIQPWINCLFNSGERKNRVKDNPVGLRRSRQHPFPCITCKNSQKNSAVRNSFIPSLIATDLRTNKQKKKKHRNSRSSAFPSRRAPIWLKP